MSGKLLSFIAAGVLAVCGLAFAAQTEDKAPTHTTVDQISNLPEESMVILQGNITQNLGEEMYVFTDSTGNINVEIDAEDLNGLNLTPDQTVIITGEVDKNGDVNEIDVEEITVVPQS